MNRPNALNYQKIHLYSPLQHISNSQIILIFDTNYLVTIFSHMSDNNRHILVEVIRTTHCIHNMMSRNNFSRWHSYQPKRYLFQDHSAGKYYVSEPLLSVGGGYTE